MTRQAKSADTLEKGISYMIEAMQEDYQAWSGDAKNHWQTIDYCDGFTVGTGRKYARVSNRNSVKAFVVLTDTDKKFQRGDILKPASWKAPARNSARGNVLSGGYAINWTGPLYL